MPTNSPALKLRTSEGKSESDSVVDVISAPFQLTKRRKHTHTHTHLLPWKKKTISRAER